MKKGIAIGLAMLFGAMCGVGTTCAIYETAKDKAVQEQDAPEETLKDGAVVNTGTGLTVTKISAENYATAGVAENVDSAYTLTATVNEDALDKRMEWSVAWKNAESTWAKGKTVTDYVTITPSEEGSLTATATCLKDFGEQIIITAKSVMNPNVFATCTVDYAKKIVKANYREGEVKETEDGLVLTLGWSGENDALIAQNRYWIISDLEYSAYTIDDMFIEKYEKKYSSALAGGGALDLTEGATEYQEFSGNLRTAPLTYVDAYALEVEGGGLITDSYKYYWQIDLAYADDANAIAYQEHIATLFETNARDLMTVRVTHTGTYSTYVDEIEIRMDSVCRPVTEVSLDNENLLF